MGAGIGLASKPLCQMVLPSASVVLIIDSRCHLPTNAFLSSVLEKERKRDEEYVCEQLASIILKHMVQNLKRYRNIRKHVNLVTRYQRNWKRQESKTEKETLSSGGNHPLQKACISDHFPFHPQRMYFVQGTGYCSDSLLLGPSWVEMFTPYVTRVLILPEPPVPPLLQRSEREPCRSSLASSTLKRVEQPAEES